MVPVTSASSESCGPLAPTLFLGWNSQFERPGQGLAQPLAVLGVAVARVWVDKHVSTINTPRGCSVPSVSVTRPLPSVPTRPKYTVRSETGNQEADGPAPTNTPRDGLTWRNPTLRIETAALESSPEFALSNLALRSCPCKKCRRLLEPFPGSWMSLTCMDFVGAEPSVSGLQARVASTSFGDHSL
jgi:hypothetical protein